jgi:hypothetical protein
MGEFCRQGTNNMSQQQKRAVFESFKQTKEHTEQDLYFASLGRSCDTYTNRVDEASSKRRVAKAVSTPAKTRHVDANTTKEVIGSIFNDMLGS